MTSPQLFQKAQNRAHKISRTEQQTNEIIAQVEAKMGGESKISGE